MNHDHSGGGMGKHMLLMLICCLVPLLLIGAVGTFGLSLGPLQGLVPFAAALMCPLMMIVMMRGMMQGQGGDHSHHHVDAPHTQPTKQIPETTPGTVTTAVAPSQEKCH
jgi:hypothetical protein